MTVRPISIREGRHDGPHVGRMRWCGFPPRTVVGRSLLTEASERLNRDLFRELGLSGDEVRT